MSNTVEITLGEFDSALVIRGDGSLDLFTATPYGEDDNSLVPDSTKWVTACALALHNEELREKIEDEILKLCDDDEEPQEKDKEEDENLN